MAADPKAASSSTGPEDGPGLNSQQPSDAEIDTNWDECVESFDAMDLREDLLRGIYAYGFEKPSAIQQVRGLCWWCWPVGRLVMVVVVAHSRGVVT